MNWLCNEDDLPLDDDVFHNDRNPHADDLATMYAYAKTTRPGLRIYSTIHDQQLTSSTSYSSSSTSVTVGSSSTPILARDDNPRDYYHHRSDHRNDDKINDTTSKGFTKYYYKQNCNGKRELNSLLGNRGVLARISTSPLFEAITKKKKQKKVSTVSQQRILNDVEDEYESCPNSVRSEVKYKLRYEIQNFLPIVLAALTISLGSCVVGFATAYTSPAIPSMRLPESTVKVTKADESWIGSLMPLSALIGGIAGGPMIELIGRKSTILATAIPFLISFLMISFAPSVVLIMAGRSLSGFCVGICSLALPVYLGETVQPEVRGTLGLLPTTFGNVGMLVCFAAGKFIDWRLLALLGACIPLPFLMCMFLIPETPQWYIAKNKTKQAKSALQWLRGAETDINQEFDEIEKTNQHNQDDSNPPGFRSLFSKMYIRPLFISLGLMFFQQMTGINAFMFYTVQIFQEAGSTVDHHLSTIVVGLVNFLSTFLATIFIDRLGRKVLLYISSISVSLMLFVMGIYFHLKKAGLDITEYGWLPLLSFVTLILGFSIGYGPIPWLMMGEVLPVKIRGPAASLATAFNWACTFVITKTFIDLQDLIGLDGGFWMFSVVTFVGIFFVIFCVPETQGKSLEDIERNLTGGPKVPVRQVRRMSSIAHLKPLPMAL